MANLIECPFCKKLNPDQLAHRHVGDATELGFQCQHCTRWASFGYFNDELLERQRNLTNRRRIRAFKRDFALYQKQIEEMLKGETVV